MAEHGAWQRAAAGAGLLQPDGSIAATIFAEMSALAVTTGAINLGQGFPDEDGPDEVLDAARKAIADGANQYPPGRGIPDLRLAIAEHQQRFYGIALDPDSQVLVTAGATEGLAAAILGLTERGDEVLTFEPFYDAYGGLIGLAGAEHTTVPLRWPDFQPDPGDLRRAVTDRTRLILVNNPHNPTGAVFDRSTLELIVELAIRHDAIIVTDEVYEHLTYGTQHVPVASLPGASDRTITLSSGGKTFNTTGWKIGWATGPANLITAITTVKQFLTYVNGAPFQPAMATGLRLPDAFFTTIADDLAAKRDILAGGLRQAGFDLSLPQASYFIVADASALGVTDAVDFCRRLPHRAGVVAVPITAFVHESHRSEYQSLVRFAFCKKTSVLEEAAARLAVLSA
ncbi:N-succinyldiaminopimelate aminotransferase [Mycetocola sp. CAN_C7]|uniref:aminotransferase class I/II-fold pyridoxal phosphate-dependent enzyme n=1 Tax=Mycetocola sp. CAN_C7 TaxID=2787724 RepID=UPI0018CA5823